MKKTIIFVAVVGIAVAALAFGSAGYAYAQDDNPDSPFGGRGGVGRHGGRGSFGMGWHDNWDGDGEAGPMHDAMSSAIADAFGLTVEELEAAHEEGKTAWDIAEEQGLTDEEFSTLMFDARSTALAQAVADGTITQEQADWMQSRWDEAKENGFGPGSGSCDGRGRGGRWSSDE